MRHIHASAVAVVLLVLLSLPDSAAPAGEDREDDSDSVALAQWVAPETRMRAGESRMLAVQLSEPATREVSVEVSAAPQEVLEPLTPLRVLEGEERAWLRVRAHQQGEARLEVLDFPELAACRIRVEPGEAFSPTQPRPSLLSPVRGAVVWGELSAGAMAYTYREPRVARLVELAPRGQAVQQELARTERFERHGDAWRASFPLDVAEQLEPGTVRLAVEVSAACAEGHETTRRSEPVPVRAKHPQGEQLTTGAAVDLAQLELPEEWGEAAVQPSWFAESQELAEGSYVVHQGPFPPSRIPFEAGEEGAWLQMSVLARGAPVAGVGPRLHVMRNQDTTQFPTVGHLVETNAWHRVPVGRPVWVEPGETWLTPLYSNDYAVEGAFNRYLFLARLELLELSQPADFSARLALATPLDGVSVHGSFEMHAHLGRTEREATRPPETVLELNGRELSRQRSEQPRFRIGTAGMRPGANRLRLWLDAGDGVALDEVEATFTWDAHEELAPRKDGVRRITAAESAWQGNVPRTHHDEAPDGRHFVFTRSDETARLSLPPGLAGEYDIALFMQGQGFEGPPEARLSLNGEGLGTRQAAGWWHSHVVIEEVSLTPGEKTVELALANPHRQRGEGERRLLVSALELRKRDSRPLRDEPLARFLYPAPTEAAERPAEIARTDAVVAEVRAGAGVIGVQLQLNGEPVPGAFHFIHETQPRADGQITLPFHVPRGLQAGRHDLQLAVIDRFQRFGQSEPLSVRVRDESEASRYARAVHLLNRFGYGPEPDLLGRMLLEGSEEVLHRLLAEPSEQPFGKRLAASRFPGEDGFSAGLRLLDTGLKTSNPVQFRVSEWLVNHFSVFANEVGVPLAWEHWRRMDALAVGRFPDALRASATSPAMMRYLDNFTNHADGGNQNYSRELLELHTLGVDGGYNEEDVRAVTRLNSGWGLAEPPNPLWSSRFAFHPRLHDQEEVVALGYRFARPTGESFRERAEASRDRGEQVLELLLAHPATAERLARRLAAAFLSEAAAANDELLDDLVEVYQASYGDLAAMLRALAEHDAFEADAGRRVADPLSFAYRLMRTGGMSHPFFLFAYLQSVTRTPLTRPAPDGFALEGTAYLDSSGMRQRWRFAEQSAEELRHRLFHGAVRWENPEPDRAWLTGLLDCLAVRFFGFPLEEQVHAELLEILEQEVDEIPLGARIGLAITLLGQSAEANLH